MRGLAAHGRGGGRGWLPAPALPRPGGRGRSVGAARRTHLAGSHPSARRGALWERGPGRRSQAALTRRTAEALARWRRRVCLWGRAGEAARYSLRGEGAKPPPSPSCDRAGDGTEGKGGSGRWDAGAELRCGRTAVAQGNAGPGGGAGQGQSYWAACDSIKRSLFSPLF